MNVNVRRGKYEGTTRACVSEREKREKGPSERYPKRGGRDFVGETQTATENKNLKAFSPSKPDRQTEREKRDLDTFFAFDDDDGDDDEQLLLRRRSTPSNKNSEPPPPTGTQQQEY